MQEMSDADLECLEAGASYEFKDLVKLRVEPQRQAWLSICETYS